MPDTVELKYDPLLLPTAQHRAGLAGLLVLRKSLELRAAANREVGPLPQCEIDGEGIVRVMLTKDALQSLFDDLFDAHWAERRSQTRPAGTGYRNLRETVDEGTADDAPPKKVFVYEVVEPKAEFYEPFGMPDPWRKLWRDAIWATLRGRPKARIPYQQRIEGKRVDQATKVWSDLTDRRRGADKPSPYSEALFVGSQSETADKVPYRGTARETLLLYFWPVVTLLGQARQTKIERKQGRVLVTDEDTGFVLAVPDVSNVEEFIEEFPGVIDDLSDELARDGYRPRDAILALPQEGALEYVYHLHRLAQAQAARSELRYSITGVETFQLMKRGNNVPILAVGRVEADERLAHDYESIRGGYWSPLFRAQLIRNLLRDHEHGDTPWWRGFDRLFDRYDSHLFAGDASSAFEHDARAKLRLEIGATARGGTDDA